MEYIVRWANPSPQPERHQSMEPFLQGSLPWVCDRPTDRATRSELASST